MSCCVSMMIASTPPSMSPFACSKKIRSSASEVMFPSAGIDEEGSMPVGPIEPATKRGWLPRREPLGGAAGEDRGAEVHLVGAVAEAVLVELQARRAERVRLDDVAADPEVAGVDVLDEVGPRQREEVVRPLLAAELRGLELVALDLGAHRAVEDEGAAVDGFSEGHVGRPRNGRPARAARAVEER